uniref:Coiled-coil domain-containing protein 9 isoform X3 n=1 Tax=Geotrypetes seraphini TaxID=260995 RepID=A0A6P8RXM2_GEOSA|nr:coiled-coil domain-containing protein 9 isoform X3 [Geotrypetes seraphini]
MSSAVDLKSKEEKDAELDKRIEALRKKNQALMKRYQEIEEDRKKAEEEGIAVTTPRKVKYSEPDKKWKERANLSITVDNTSSSEEQRVNNDRKASPTPRNVVGPPNRTSPSRDPGRTTVRHGPSPSNRSPNTERPSWEGSRDGVGRGGKGHRSRGGGRAMPGYGGRDLVGDEGGAAPYSERGRGSATPGRGGQMERGPRTDDGGGDAGVTLCGPDRRGGGRAMPGYGGRDLVGDEGGAAPYSERGRGSATPGRGGRMERGPRTDDGGGDAGATLCGPDRRGGGRAMPGYGGRDLVDFEGGAAPYSERGRGSATSGRGGRMERGSRTDDGGGDAGVTLCGPDRKTKEWEEKRRQNIEKMNEDMEKIAEYERSQRDGVREMNPFRNFLDDPRRSGPFTELDRKEGSRRHTRNWGGTDFEKVKTGMEQERASHGRRSGPKDTLVDMTLSMTGRERAEYMRWKKEREQIDQERLARHRKPTGQWRREWDAEKNETMFKDGVEPVSAPVGQGGRREESRRAPRPPTFGEFLSEGRTAEPGRKKGRGRSRTQGKVYSMHDDRWEKGEKEEVVEEEEVVENKEDNRRMEKEERSPEPERSPKIEEEDDDEWEDEDEETTIGGADSEEDVEDIVSQPVTVLVKDQRSPRQHGTPKLKMPPSDPSLENTTQEVKPLSPFSPTDEYQPVSDWGEEMEQQSPRSSNEDSPPRAENSKGCLKAGPPQAVDPAPKSPEDIVAGSGIITVTVGDNSATPVQDLSEVLEEVATGSSPEPREKTSIQLEADIAADESSSDGSAAAGSEIHQTVQRELSRPPPESELGTVSTLSLSSVGAEPFLGTIHKAASEMNEEP